jgi:hypothetical protein
LEFAKCNKNIEIEEESDNKMAISNIHNPYIETINEEEEEEDDNLLIV